MNKILRKSLALVLAICMVLTMSFGTIMTSYATDVAESLPVQIAAGTDTAAPGDVVNVELSLTTDAALYMLEGAFASDDEGISIGSVTSSVIEDCGSSNPGGVVYLKDDALQNGGVSLTAGQTVLSVPVTVASNAPNGTYTVEFNLEAGGVTVPLAEPVGSVNYDGVAYTESASFTATFTVAHDHYYENGVCTVCGDEAEFTVSVDGATPETFTVAQLDDDAVTEYWYYSKNGEDRYTTVTGILFSDLFTLVNVAEEDVCTVTFSDNNGAYSKNTFKAGETNYEERMLYWSSEGSKNGYHGTGFSVAAAAPAAGNAWPDGMISAAISSEHNYVATVTTAPTCTQPGILATACAICGKVIATEEIPAAHNYQYVCNGDGTHDYVCTGCGDVDIDNEACTDGDSNTICDVCGGAIAAPELETSITTQAQLEAIASAVSLGFNLSGQTFTLMNDLTLTGAWTPIGTEATAFAGTFDGNGQTISGLDVQGGANLYQGLFGNNAGIVKDFTINGTVTSTGPSSEVYVSAVAGFNSGTISGVTSNVNITTGNGSYAIGGIAGRNTGIVTQCANTGAVTSGKHMGGIVGSNFGTVSYCYNTGNVTGAGGGKDAVGGIVGCGGDKNSTYTNTVTYCWNSGAIDNPSGRWFGGVVGFIDGATTVSYSYNTGTVGDGYKTQSDSVVGTNEGSVDHCYALDTTAKTGTDHSYGIFSQGGTVTNCELFTTTGAAVLLTNLNSGTNTEAFKTGETYPVLFWQPSPVQAGFEVTLVNNTGNTATVTGLTDGAEYNGTVTFTVACAKACVVAVGDALSATALTATPTGNANEYSFTVNVDEAKTVNVVLRGDANGSGRVDSIDYTTLGKFLKGRTSLDAIQLLAGNIDNSPGIYAFEINTLGKNIRNRTTFNW